MTPDPSLPPASAPSSGALVSLRITDLVRSQRFTLRSRGLMLALSHLIEDTAASLPMTTLFAAFQRYSLVVPQLERYARIAPALSHTYIFGLPDRQVPELPNTTFVALHEPWPLIHEWVVFAAGPQCYAGLFARDEEMRQPRKRARQFNGAWTTDISVIEQARQAVLSALGLPCPRIDPDTRGILQTGQRLQRELTARLR
jgi:DICT domain-containing protein